LLTSAGTGEIIGVAGTVIQYAAETGDPAARQKSLHGTKTAYKQLISLIWKDEVAIARSKYQEASAARACAFLPF
jgi:hypothetical protein